MNKEKIERINFLAEKSKGEGLTQAESDEQLALRKEYILEFRQSFKGILDNSVIKYPDGSIERVSERKKK